MKRADEGEEVVEVVEEGEARGADEKASSSHTQREGACDRNKSTEAC